MHPRGQQSGVCGLRGLSLLARKLPQMSSASTQQQDHCKYVWQMFAHGCCDACSTRGVSPFLSEAEEPLPESSLRVDS